MFVGGLGIFHRSWGFSRLPFLLPLPLQAWVCMGTGEAWGVVLVGAYDAATSVLGAWHGVRRDCPTPSRAGMGLGQLLIPQMFCLQ